MAEASRMRRRWEPSSVLPDLPVAEARRSKVEAEHDQYLGMLHSGDGGSPLSVQDGGLSPSIQAESIHNEKEHQTISITIGCQITPYKLLIWI